MSGSQLLLLGGTPQVIPDPNFEYTTLLLPGNGTNGAQNNTFLDSSTNNFTITRNGNTTQGTFSPFSQTGWGNYFDGNADYLTVASNAAFGYGTGDFTIEMWIYPTVIQGASTPNLFDQRTANPQVVPTIYLNNGQLIYYVNGLNRITGATLTANRWYHIAVCRASGSTRMFLNGTQTGSTYADANNYITSPITIFTQGPAAAIYQEGYCSNLRIVKGTALYTTAFTPPTTPLTAISGTSLLTCQSNRFIDNSTNNFAITRNGDVSVQAFSPFNPTAAWSAATNGGSGYFDGSGDYLTAPSDAAFALSGDFSMECWAYFAGATAVGGGSSGELLYAADATGGAVICVRSGTLIALSAKSIADDLSASVTFTPGQWYHLVAARTGTTAVLYVNGTRVATGTVSRSYAQGGFSTQSGFNGYLTSVRIVKGSNPYGTGTTITVPTAPLTAITNTSLLLNYTNAGIYDATSKNDLETVGNAQISTTQSKFGGSSMYFDGSGDGLAMPSAPLLQLGSGDFTVEAWVYFSGNLPYQDGDGLYSAALFGQQASSGLIIQFRSATSSAPTSIYYTVAGVGSNSVAFSFSLNTWYHVAVSRNAGTARIFVNGNQITSFASTTNLAQSTTQIGWLNAANFNQYFLGYIDDVRVTKGVARYTANFTAPTAAFPLL